MSEEKIEQKVEETKPNDKEYNFAQIRKQLEQERAEKKQLAEKIANLEQEVKARSKQEAHLDDDDDSDEPYVDQKRLKKQLSKFEQKLQSQFESAAEQKANQLLEAERQKSFLKTNSDFNTILSSDNIQKFADKYPEIAEQMLELPDSFARQKLLYQNIKALGVHKKEEEKSIQAVIEEKKRSPYYQPTGVGASPYNGMGDFSATGQQSAYKKMQELKSKLRI